jgi:hypothetical protein
LKTRRLEKSGVFILLKACPTGFFHGKTTTRSFNFLVPGVLPEEFSTPVAVVVLELGFRLSFWSVMDLFLATEYFQNVLYYMGRGKYS